MSIQALSGEMLHHLSRDQLVHVLETIHGTKDIYIDPVLMKPLDRVAGATLLRNHGVDKIFKLERAAPPMSGRHRVYLVRPNLVLVKYICDQINSNADDTGGGGRGQVHIVFTPKILHACRHLLEEEGVLGVAELHQYALDFVALDADLWSLEMPELYRDFFLDGCTALLEPVARAVWRLQSLCGLIPRIHAHGRAAQQVVSLLEFFRSELGEPRVTEPEVGHLVVLDRDVDPAAALLSQLTYAGIVDETFGVKCGVLELGADVTGTEKSVKLMLHSKDEVYRDIRDRHFSAVFPVLRQRAKQLQQAHSKRQEMSVEQMKGFIQSQLREVQAQHMSLGTHIGACEAIMKRKTRSFEEQLRAEHSIVDGLDMRENLAFIEQNLARQSPPLATLRLMCLYSIAQGGVPSREYQSLVTQFVQSHGFHHLVTLHNLKRLGLFTEQAGGFGSGPAPGPPPAVGDGQHGRSGSLGGGAATRLLSQLPAGVLGGGRQTAQLAQKVAQSVNLARQSAFKTVTRKLALIPESSDNYDLRTPPDAGYVFSGAYIPVSCALLRLLLVEGSWGAAAEAALRLLPGETVRRRQTDAEPPRVVLLLLLGGVTMAEVAGLQQVARALSHRLVVLTTAVVTGNTLLEGVARDRAAV
ncbi:Vacuolar protein sorting-associated protein 33B [Amphibalanus amphitrite]|uniref:Vacuolar protein sorting-associated protein 33B n=1 Tax=Amphibalanus amphitrite TaxID=1232801 RepID=A0A6A4W0H7_AMPAM|nr:Vacuolar protein sorting-associated protein 33B [Amphibalanus amphitrite]